MDLHAVAMEEARREWRSSSIRHSAARRERKGIRSSQISALIAYLIRIGAITEENVHPD